MAGLRRSLMGIGDEIMAAGQAERVWRETGDRVVVLDRKGQPRWHEVWDGNPAIARDKGEGVRALTNCSGARPYIRYPWNGGPMRFTDWRAAEHVASLHLTAEERAFADALVAGYVVIEPNIKARANPNKDWGFARYRALMKALPDVRFVQVGPGPALEGAERFPTPSFRHACAVLERSEGYVGAEGAMHHAAAALRKPAVVIFGSSSPPSVLGYDSHTNLASGEPCGERTECRHCRAEMDRITVADVAAAVRSIL